MADHQATDGEVLRNLAMIGLLLAVFMLCLAMALMVFL